MKKWEFDLFSNTLEEICQNRVDEFNKDRRTLLKTKAQDFVDFSDYCQEVSYSKKHTDFPFITINTRPGTQWQLLYQGIQDILHHFHWAIYSIELGKNGNLHAHLVGYNKSWNTNWSRTIKRPFQDFCLVANEACFKVKWAVSNEDLKQLESYIKKTFASKSKSKADKLTHDFREQEGIDPVYYHGDIPSCLSPTLQLILLN